ncbi:GFA family protein [Pseudodonghicola xiamenensis]|uniref:Aldehyde-activating protein n=1 Tax=Pseudodonghicola xiamenensis TaxID=337702 RepID=A0A8J3H677_9RHOB|nr:GFA family protein [Pseudodonghicola xiamenensis]GHG91701.1 aldehyde-activating protein [Pseudodonghicola xiamenensis]
MTGLSAIPEIRLARCHCGAVVIEAFLPEGLASARRCDCSLCRRRGPGAVTALTARLRVLQGQDNLGLYTWGTHRARHYFCKTCGIYTHHQRRSNPAECGINIGCLDGIDPRDFSDIPWTDGVNYRLDGPD